MASVTRRNLITKGVLAAAGALVALPEVARAMVPTKKVASSKLLSPVADTMPWLSRPLLAAHLNDAFQVFVPSSGWMAMRLIRLDDANAALPGSPDCFVAVFETSTGTPLAQGTYTVNQRALGNFTLFLVPGGKNKQRSVCTATVNRVHA